MKPTQLWWFLSAVEVCKFLKTDSRTGLSQEEATTRLRTYGKNTVTQVQGISLGALILRQFSHLFVLILIAAGILASILGSWIDAVAIFFIVVANALIGFIQEYGSERSLEALRRMTQPQATVVRDGLIQPIDTLDLVPGDLVVLQDGAVVPADGRVIESRGLFVDESALTGESVADSKQDAALADTSSYTIGDQSNMVFMGTHVVKGYGFAVITETGSATQFGQIATYVIASKEPETQLSKQLRYMGYALMVFSGLVGSLVMSFGMMQGTSFYVLLFTAVSLFVASVPEGLPAVITIALARSARRMAARHALIRRLTSVEALSSISVICTDKTGTLTQNKMTVQHIFLGVSDAEISLKGGQQDIPQDLYEALLLGMLCNGARLDREGKVYGDPTEGALLTCAATFGLHVQDFEKQFPLVKEYPFDSTRMRMGTLRKAPLGYKLYVKGAPDRVLERCTKILERVPRKLEEADRLSLQRQIDESARNALRVIAVAYREGAQGEFLQNDEDEKDLTFVGLFAMIDPPRLEAKESLDALRMAGVRTLMLTGDHKETARAIARKVELIEENDQVLTGTEIEELSDHDLMKLLPEVSVYARVTVAHKIRIVELLRKTGQRVAMIGDGVNDAPALKVADIGIAMGTMGTDVAKEASDLIITDDNYASIVDALEEGRGMYESIMKFVRYQLSTNLAEIFVVFWGVSAHSWLGNSGPAVILLPVQLLWINLVSDGLPAVALVFDPLHTGLLKKQPKEFTESLVSISNITRLAGVGLIISFGVLGAYVYGLLYMPEAAQTMAFTSLVLLEFVRLLSIRADYQLSFFSNYLVLLAIATSLVLQILIIYVPSLQKVFRTEPLDVRAWIAMMLIIAVTWLVYVLFSKIFKEKVSA